MKIWKVIQLAQERNPLLLWILVLVTVVSSFIQAFSSVTVAPVIDLMVHPDLKQASPATLTILKWLHKVSIPTSLLWLIILFLLVTVIKNLVTAASKDILTRIRVRMVRNIILQQYRAFIGSSWGYFVSHQQGTLSNSIITETEKVGITFQTMGDMANAALCVLFYLGVGLCISWKVTTIVTLLTLLGLAPVLLVGKRIHQLGQEATQKNNQFQGAIMESFNAAKLIMGYGNRQGSYERLTKIVDPLMVTNFKYVMIRAVTPLAFEPVGFAVILLAVYLSWNHFHLTVAEIFLLLYVFKMISQYGLSLVDLRNYLKNISPGIEQIHDLRLEAMEFQQLSGSRVFDQIRDKIELRHIDFSYPNHKQVLSDICVTIPKAKMIAIVGRSGSGKTTLIDILMGFYKPQNGSYTIDGVDFGQFDIESWRKRIGYIPQEAFLFNMSVKDNLLWGFETATAQDIAHALELSNAQEFVQMLPLKENTIVGDHGVRLSGGQRQRIALARAILRKPDLLILDEATSSLDSHSEIMIQKAIENITGETTIVTIAHRLSTIRQADHIYVLDKGKIVEEGAFSHLMTIKNGEFLKTAEIQGIV